MPDLLVVTKADLGDPARRARRELEGALRSLGAAQTPVLAVSSLPPAQGIGELVGIDAHRARLDGRSTRVRSRRLTALSEFAAEHGERGLRALGVRRAAERVLDELDPVLETPKLVAALESAARVGPVASAEVVPSLYRRTPSSAT